jgi:hypothetical protein
MQMAVLAEENPLMLPSASRRLHEHMVNMITLCAAVDISHLDDGEIEHPDRQLT